MCVKISALDRLALLYNLFFQSIGNSETQLHLDKVTTLYHPARFFATEPNFSPQTAPQGRFVVNGYNYKFKSTVFYRRLHVGA